MMVFKNSNNTSSISQMKYTLDILADTSMLDCKPVDTPGRYQQLVGKLNYLTITQPNISFPMSIVSQFLQSPCNSHWDVVVRILCYIEGTPG